MEVGGEPEFRDSHGTEVETGCADRRYCTSGRALFQEVHVRIYHPPNFYSK